MSFDGVPRPTQLNPYADPTNPCVGAHQASHAAAHRPRVSGNKETFGSEGVRKELAQYRDSEDKESKEELTDEEREQLMLFAKLRGIMNFSLDSGVLYRFDFNDETERVELIDDRDGSVVLVLTIDDMLAMSLRMERYAGMITDREA